MARRFPFPLAPRRLPTPAPPGRVNRGGVPPKGARDVSHPIPGRSAGRDHPETIEELLEMMRHVGPKLFPGATALWIGAEIPVTGGKAHRSKLLVPLEPPAPPKPKPSDEAFRAAILKVLGELLAGEGMKGEAVAARTEYQTGGVWKHLAALQKDGLVGHKRGGYFLIPVPSADGKVPKSKKKSGPHA